MWQWVVENLGRWLLTACSIALAVYVFWCGLKLDDVRLGAIVSRVMCSLESACLLIFALLLHANRNGRQPEE